MPETEVAVLRPTRGLEFAESSDSIEEALQGYAYRVKRTWDKPIPDSFNWLTRWALDNTDAPYFLFVEEDVVIPPFAMEAMLQVDADITAINYRLKVDNRISEFWKHGKLLWVSLGCTLVKRRVFETLPEPWFSCDYALVNKSTGSACKEKFLAMEYNPRSYAGQDAYLCWNAIQEKFTVDSVRGVECAHLRLDALGEADRNNGCHRISRV